MRAAGLGLGLIALIGLSGAACGSDPRPAPADKPEEPTQAKDPNLPSNLIAQGVTVKDVAVFQGVKVPIVADGETYSGKQLSPVVANRQGILRVYVSTAAGFKSGSITAELRLVGPDGTTFPTIRETKKISGASTEEDADSTFNLEFPASSFPEGVSFQVWLTATDGVETEEAKESDGRYPKDGTLWQDVGAIPSGKVKIVLVPVIYTADGSNRATTTDADQLKLYKDAMLSRYPASGVEITLHEPFKYAAEISAQDGQSWADVLAAIRNLRAKDKVADDIYYFGSFMPTKTFQSFCSGGCIAGLSTVGDDVRTAELRASVGVGYPGAQAAETMAHEIGHAHGREHAPCGNPAGVDPKFPYTNATLGSWGYNILTKDFYSPKTFHDIMAYCPPNEWVSDYTYKALFKRISSLTKLVSEPANADVIAAAAKTEGYAIATVDGSGNAKWERDAAFSAVLTGGTAKRATLFGQNGETLRHATARFFPYDHAPGGVMYIPQHANDAWKDITFEGSVGKLSR